MTWVIACFCGQLIDTPTCPHCGSRLPDFASPAPDRTGLRLYRSDDGNLAGHAQHLAAHSPHRRAA
jgi:hypothetical protein